MSAEESAARLTADFSLSTYYFDGTPARCAVTIRALSMKILPGETEPMPVLLRTIGTNSYGVAKVFDLPVPPEAIGNNQLTVSFEADDKTGAAGKDDQTDFLYHGE